jgi:hypothetical protein
MMVMTIDNGSRINRRNLRHARGAGARDVSQVITIRTQADLLV